MEYYKIRVINRLERLNGLKQALVNIPERRAALKYQRESIRAAKTDGTPVANGSNGRDEMLISNLTEDDELKYEYDFAKSEVTIIDRALAELTRDERIVICRLCLNNERRGIERLVEELGYEQAQIYRIRNQALLKLAWSLHADAQA